MYSRMRLAYDADDACGKHLKSIKSQNRDYNRSPTPVYDMAPFLHCACVRSAIFLASKTAASTSKLYGESLGQCKKTAIKS